MRRHAGYARSDETAPHQTRRDSRAHHHRRRTTTGGAKIHAPKTASTGAISDDHTQLIANPAMFLPPSHLTAWTGIRLAVRRRSGATLGTAHLRQIASALRRHGRGERTVHRVVDLR